MCKIELNKYDLEKLRLIRLKIVLYSAITLAIN